MKPEIIASLLGTLVTALAAIIVALIQAKSKKSEQSSTLLVPEGYRIHQPQTPKKWIFVLPIALFGGIVSYFSVSWFYHPPTSLDNKNLIDKIAFDYPDSPVNHGWVILDSPAPTFRQVSSGFAENALEITSYDGHAMDLQVKTAARFGTVIELAVKLEERSVFYVLVDVQSTNKSDSKEVWYAFVPGTEQPWRVNVPDYDEWTVYLTPIQVEGEWLLFRVDLQQTVRDTVGSDWSLAQLLKFRLRGNLSLAYIAIYE